MTRKENGDFSLLFFLGLSERVNNILCCCVCAHGKLQPFLLNRRTIKEMRIYLSNERETKTKHITKKEDKK
jgi:hypothetical protein